jgi:hypothetical protein
MFGLLRASGLPRYSPTAVTEALVGNQIMSDGGRLTKCERKDCGRIISLARTHPGERKPPEHKRFCGDACRQAHHRSKKKG